MVSPRLNCYPADERTIAQIECGRSCGAVVALPVGGSLAAGDTILFALSHSRPGQFPVYVKGGNSVVVVLNDVADLGGTDPNTGQALVRITWEPPGRHAPQDTDSGSGAKTRRSRRMP